MFLWRTDLATLTFLAIGQVLLSALMHSTNSLDPDVAQQNVGHNLDPNFVIF